MSFSGQSNPPWQRNSMNNSMQGNMQNVGSGQIPMSSSNSGMGYHQNSQMFMNQQSSQQNQNMQYNQMGTGNMNQMSSNQVFPQGVSYPSRTGLNPVAFQNTGSGSGSASGQSQANNMGMHSQNRQSYNSMGTVTKISNDCGLVNDEVLFYKNICKGVVPKVGDRVLFESTYSPNTQFKWNASRVQLVSQASAQAPPPPLMSQNIKSSGYNAVPPPNEYRALNSQRRSSPGGARRGSPINDRHSIRDRKESNRGRDRSDRGDRSDFEIDRKKRREESPRNRDRDRRATDRRDVSLDKKDRDRSPVRRQSPKRRKTRPIPRYVVQIPKTLLTFKSGGVQEIKRRYSNLYIPSDFFHTQVKWSETFTPDNPFSMRRPSSFHITHKAVEPLNEIKVTCEPDDVDYLFSAKVMLLGCPPISEIYSKCFNQDEHDDSHHCIHPSRLINFLVGTRARNEPMAIGGPWSPSMDGENPDKDPAVLIRTAIRTCLSLTGIDLSNCTQWYRFVELYYHRADYTSKGKSIPSRVETVVIYLPDISSCMPTRSEWDCLAVEYKTAATNHLNRIKTAAAAAAAQQSITDAGIQSDEKSTQSAAGQGDDAATVPDSATSLANLGGEDGDKPNNEIGHEKDEIKKEPTHYSKLDLKTMKIQEIRDELVARNLSSKGLRPQVLARLSKTLTMEKEKNENDKDDDEDSKKDEDVADDTDTKYDDGDAGIELDMTDIVILDEYDSSKNTDADNVEKEQSKELDEKGRKQLERRYALPEEPHIIVHPSKSAKDGKFDCTVMSLSVLLDYRPEDTKERFFEVSLFAELFNEMLMRDFGFNIFKELYFHKEPEVEKEEAKKDEIKPSVNDDEETSTKDNSNQEPTSAEKKPQTDADRKDKNLRDRRVSKRPLDDDTEDDGNSVSSERKKRSEKKMFVAKPQLLLSFIYFDTTHCGYIFEKDLEELFLILGLSLSRAEIRKSLSKSISRHALYYRKLTDSEEKPESLPIEDSDEVSIEELRKVAMGNTNLLPVFKTDDDQNDKQPNLSKSEDGDGMVTYNGVLMHVGKLFEQNKRYEKSYSELEQLYNEMKKQNTELQSNYTRASTKAKDLQSEVKSLLRKLSDADQDLFTLNRKYNEQHSALGYVYDKIVPFVSRSEKSHKSSDGSRDRDSTKEKKEEKDKEKKEGKEKKEDNEKKEDKEKKDEKEKEKPDDKLDKEKPKDKIDNGKDVKPEIKIETE